MTPFDAMARYCAWWAMWCRAWGLDDLAHEWTRHADGWRALGERYL